jgi:hypothetical protein
MDFIKNKEQQYICTDKINGQFLQIKFYEEIYYDKILYFVCFEIRNKRYQIGKSWLKTTGKIGLSGLLWAKEKIKEFENFIINKKIEKEKISMYILVGWEDNRRRKVYERGLKNLGYKIDYMVGRKLLIKKIS